MTEPVNKEIYVDYLGNVHEKPADVAPRWRISAYALVRNDNKYLLVKQMGRADWELPGGGVEIDESVQDGVLREVYEETGYRIRVGAQPIYVGERKFFGLRDNVCYKNVMLAYRGELVSLAQDKHIINTIVKNEISEVSWLRTADLNEKNFHPMFWPVIQSVQG